MLIQYKKYKNPTAKECMEHLDNWIDNSINELEIEHVQQWINILEDLYNLTL